MLLLQYLRFLALFTIYEISTKTYVYGRPSTPAAYHLSATAERLDEAETSPSRTIPGLTPEESADVVEKILRGELQPVMKTDELKSAASDGPEVPVPTPPARLNTNIMDTPQQFDEHKEYLEPSQASSMVPEQVLPTVKTPFPISPSLSQPTDGGVVVSPGNYRPTNKLSEKEKQVRSAESIFQPSNDNDRSRARNLQLDSTQKSQIFPEIEDTGFEDYKPVPSKRSLPSMSTKNLTLEGQTLSLKPTTDSSLLRDPDKDSSVSHDLPGINIQDAQNLTRSDVTNSDNDPFYPDRTVYTVPRDGPVLRQQRNLVDTVTKDSSATPEFSSHETGQDVQNLDKITDTSISDSYFVDPESVVDSVLHERRIPVNAGSIDSYVPPKIPSVPPRISVQEVQELPKTIDTSISYNIPVYPKADPKSMVFTEPTNDLVLHGRRIPVKIGSTDTSVLPGKPSVPPQISVEEVQDLPKIIDTSISYNIPLYPNRKVLPAQPTDVPVLDEQTMPIKLSKDAPDIQDHGKSSSLSQDLPRMSSQDVQDLTKNVHTGTSEKDLPFPKSSGSAVPTDDLVMDGQTIPVALTKVSSDTQGYEKIFPHSQDLPKMYLKNAPNTPTTVETDILPDQLVSYKGTPQTAPTEQSVSVKSSDPRVFEDNVNYSDISQDIPKKSVQDILNLPDPLDSDMIENQPDYLTSQAVPNGDLVLDRKIMPFRSVGLQLNNESGNVQDILDAGTDTKVDMATFHESFAPKVAAGIPVLTGVVKHMTGRPPGVQISNYNTPSVAASGTAQSNTRGIPISGFRNFKHSSPIDPRNVLGSQPVKNLAVTSIPRCVEIPSRSGNKLEENFAIDPIIQFRDSQPSSHYRGKSSEEELEKPSIVRKVITPSKDFRDFRNVDMDLLALSDVLDSESDSRSDEDPWSYEESVEDGEFWKKMKQFMNNEKIRNSPEPNQRDEIQSDIITSPYISVKNINAIPSSYTKPNVMDNLHVMQSIAKSMTNNTVLDVRSGFDVNLDKAQDRDSETISDIPIEEESSTLFFNDEFTRTEATTSVEDLLLNDTFNLTDMDIGDIFSDGLTTEGPLSYLSSPTERDDFGEEPMILDNTTVKNYQPDEEFGPVEEETTYFHNDSTPKYEDDKSVDLLNNRNFQEESPERFTRDDVLSSNWDILPRSVGWLDDFRELKSDPVLPQDDSRFSESVPETFSTDEPLLAEEDAPVEYPINSTASGLGQGTEIPPSKPTDLNLIEAESPTPVSCSSGHFVSKKDDPMNTVPYLLKNDKNHKPLHKDKITESLPEDLFMAPDKLISPPSDDKSSSKNTRVRRSNNNTTARPEKPGLNYTSTNVYPVPTSSELQSIISTVTPPISITLIPTLPTSTIPIKTKESPVYLTTSAVIHFPHTTPVTPALSISTVSHAPSTQPTTLIPSTTSVTSAPSTMSRNPATSNQSTALTPSTTSATPAPSTHSETLTVSTISTTLDPPTTFELLPTPVPETSTPTNLFTSTPAPTSSIAPKKKKKKMVWNIPFYPNNIAITSTGEVRLEPKDKSATTTTAKPHLRDRLKPEDLQAARERLLRRFHFRRPAVVPIPNTSKGESLRPQTGQPSVPKVPNQSLIGEQAGKRSAYPLVDGDVLAYVTAEDPSKLPSLFYNSPEEREEARKRRLRNVVGLAGDVRSLLSERARHAVKTVGSIVGGGGEGNKKENQ